MRIFSLWIVTLIMLSSLVSPLPVQRVQDEHVPLEMHGEAEQRSATTTEGAERGEGEIISVRITSSVAVNRGKGKPHHDNATRLIEHNVKSNTSTTGTLPDTTQNPINITIPQEVSVTPQELEGANIEFIKQLKAKKEARVLQNIETLQSFHETVTKPLDADSEVEESMKLILEVPLNTQNQDYYSEDVPLARSVPFDTPRQNYIHGQNKNPNIDRINQRLTTAVSYQIVHNTPKSTTIYNDHTDQSLSYSTVERLYSVAPKEFSTPPKLYTKPQKSFSESPKYFIGSPEDDSDIPKSYSDTLIPYSEPPKTFSESSKSYSEPAKSYSEPSKVYSEPEKIYSQPAKVYSEPAKFYSEPAKVYGEPAKVYSEPAKIYSEPAKVYGEPAKFYSQPASLHLPPQTPVTNWADKTETPAAVGGTASSTPQTTTNETSSPNILEHHNDHQPEKNYEVDEKVSVMTDGKRHGVQESTSCKEDNCKVGYVVEGRQYRKYRVEERTPDGFLVGEYGVVRHQDGALRGVRYTAAGDASPTLIYDALMKFLQLK